MKGDEMKDRGNDRRTPRLALIWGTVLLFLILIGVFLYARVNTLLNRYMEVQGEKQAETLAELTQRQFQVELAALYTVASELTHIEGMRTDALRAIQEADYDGRIGVQMIDGSPFYGETYTPGDFPCIERAVHGENAVSFCPGKGLMFCVPALRGDNIAFVVYRLYPEEILFARFGVISYGGSGRTRIEDQRHQIVIPPLSADSAETQIFDETTGTAALSVGQRRPVPAFQHRGSDALYRRHSGQRLSFGRICAEIRCDGGRTLHQRPCHSGLYRPVRRGVLRRISSDPSGKQIARERRPAGGRPRRGEVQRREKHVSPMNAIIGFTNLAIQDPADTDRVREYLGKIQASSNHLLSLINDVLEMSRIESGKIELEEKPCSLPKILHDLNTIIIGQVESRQQELTMDAVNVSNENVWCDKLRLNQVLLNLLSNAVKYTPPGGKISVRVIQSASKTPGRAAYEFRVKDNGIGMTPEFAARVFEAFEREKTSTVSGIQGTGLGMAITRSIVNLMGGTIRVETEKDKGSPNLSSTWNCGYRTIPHPIPAFRNSAAFTPLLWTTISTPVTVPRICSPKWGCGRSGRCRAKRRFCGRNRPEGGATASAFISLTGNCRI